MSVESMYVLGFTGFLAQLIEDQPGYQLTDPPRTGADSTGARFTVRNAIGETFVVDVEHVRGPGR